MLKQGMRDLCERRFRAGKRLVAPLMGFPGVQLIGSNIKLAQQNYAEHYRAVKVLADRFRPDILFPVMDLSVEANALGRYTVFPTKDPAAVPKEPFDIGELDRLRDVNIGCDTRLIGYVETIKLMNIGLPAKMIRGAYVTGPYSLVSLILGADEAAMATVMNPDALGRICAFATEEIGAYIRLLTAAGAELIAFLEPSAQMLSPDQFEQFSGTYVKHLVRSLKYGRNATMLHICGRSQHLMDRMVASGVDVLSVDSPQMGVDLPALLEQVPEEIILMGNICPATVMLREPPEKVRDAVVGLLRATAAHPNFILSTGCDLPRETPPSNIETFMATGRESRWKRD